MKKFFIGLLGCLLILLLTFFLIPKDILRDALLKVALNQIESSSNFRLEITSATFEYPFTLQAQSIKLYEKKTEATTPWLTAEKVSVSLNPIAFLSSKISIPHFQCAQLSLLALPENAHSQSSTHLNIPEIPFGIKIAHYAINSFKVSSAVLQKLPLSSYLQGEKLVGGVPIDGCFSAKTFFHSLKLEVNVGTYFSKDCVTSVFLSVQRTLGSYALSAAFFEAPQGIIRKPELLEASAIQVSLAMQEEGDRWKGKFESTLENLAPNTHPSSLEGRLEGNFSYSDTEFLHFEHVTGITSLAKFSGSGSLSSQLEFSETQLQLSLKSGQWAGIYFDSGIDMHIGLQGPVSAPLIQGSFSSESLQFKDWEIFAPEVALSLNPWDPDKIGWIKFSGKYANLILQGSSDLSIKDQKASFANFSAHYGSTLFDGYFTVAPAPSLNVQGALKGFNLALSDWYPQVQGAGNLQIYLDVDTSNQQRLQADLWIEQGSYQEIDLASAHAYLDLHDVFGERKGHLRMEIRNGRWGKASISEGLFATEFLPGASLSDFTLTLSGDLQKPFQFASKGKWQIAQKELPLFSLDTLEGHAFDYPITLVEPITFELRDDRTELSPLFLAIGPGSLYAISDSTPSFIQFTLRIKQLPLAIAHLFAPEFPLRGFAAGQVFLFGSPSHPRGQLELDFSDVKLEEEAFTHFPPLHMIVQAALVDDVLECNASITGIEKNPLQAEAKIPFALSISPFSTKINRDYPLSVQLYGHGPLSPILSLFVVDKTSIDGEAELHLGIAGTFNSPKVNGYAILRNGTFESLTSGAALQDINAKIIGKGHELLLEHFTANDAFNGNIAGQGKLLLDSSQKFPFETHFELNKLHLIQNDFVQTIASGQLTLNGDQERGRLSGTLISNKTQMTIPNQIPELTQTVEVTYINLPENEAVPVSYQEKPAEWPLELNIELQFPSKASLGAKGLTSEWEGNLLLKGSTDSPLLEGKLRTTKGDYLLNGKKFLLKEGSVIFSGDPMTDSALYVVGAMDLGKIVAELIVKGPIKNPTVSLTSNPPLSQQEILSWLLFGKGFSEISPYQGDQLTASLADLSKNDEGPDLLTKIRNRTGIDRIDINRSGEGDSGDVSFEVGKYITQGTYVSVSKNMGTESNEVNIETSIFKNFKLQAGVSDDANGHFDIIWKYDY